MIWGIDKERTARNVTIRTMTMESHLLGWNIQICLSHHVCCFGMPYAFNTANRYKYDSPFDWKNWGSVNIFNMARCNYLDWTHWTWLLSFWTTIDAAIVIVVLNNHAYRRQAESSRPESAISVDPNHIFFSKLLTIDTARYMFLLLTTSY